MNKIYRSIWNELTGTFVAVAEIATARGKRVGSQMAGAFGALFGLTPLAVGLMAAGLAQAAPPVPTQLPTGGTVVAGQASITQANAVMNVTQTSSRAVVDWGSFNVGSSATVNFVQPSSSSAILNRVQDANPSQILGRINANGQVFLTNPSGIYFGQNATINVGALTATTHSIGNADFMDGKLNFSRDGATGSVVNDGSIHAALGGYIALLAPEVRNNGVVVAQMGTVALAAGEAYELQFDGARLASVRVEPATIAALVENKQAVQAPGGLIILSAQAASRLQGGVINNSGSLEATGLTDNGGTIRLSASDKISHIGSISVDAAANSAGNGGSVSLIADLANASSVTEVNGSISARAGALGGNGGFVETSGGRVRVGDSATFDTQAPMGQAGTWLIDPDGFTIAATGGDMTGTTLSNNLARGSVVIASTTGAIGSASSGNDGNVNVNDNVWWGANKLYLTATNDVNVNAVMTMTGTSQLDVTTGASGRLNMGFDTGGNFKGRIDLPGRTGTFVTGTTPILTVNGDNYTVINTAQALQDLNLNTTTRLGKYVLGADLDASGIANWVPIGTSAAKFSGILNGLGHSISNVTVNRPTTNDVGLFGYVDSLNSNGYSTPRISNLGVVNAAISGQNGVGALAGTMNYAQATNVFATGLVSGTGWVGGLFGRLTSGALDRAHANAAATASSQMVGGLIGFMDGSTVTNAYATGAAATGSSYAGGLVGYGQGNSTLSNVYATGSVTSTAANFPAYLGGLMGYGKDISISNAYATGNVSITGSGGGSMGGLIGGTGWGNFSLQNAFATGNVTGNLNALDSVSLGGLIGAFVGGGTVENVFATGNVVGAQLSAGGGGGLVGSIVNGTILNGYATGTVNGHAMDGLVYQIDTNTPLLTYGGAIGQRAATGNTITNVGYTQPILTTNTWIGTAGDGQWATAGNWFAGHAPTVLEKADVGANTVSIGQIVMAGDISASTGSQIKFTGSLVSSLTVGQTGTVTLGTSANDVAIDYGTSGKVNLPAAGQLSYNGSSYTVINTVGTATDKTTTGNNTLQGMAYYSSTSANNMLSGRYVLGMDIDASDTATWNSNTGFTPIGSYSSQPHTAFEGTLDGLGHSVVNMTINRPATANVQAQLDAASYQGLFGYISDGSLANVGTVGAKVTGYYYVGALAGDVDVTAAKSFTNLWSVDSQVKGADNVGGAIGAASAGWGGSLAFSNVHVSGTVTGSTDIADLSYSYARLRAGGVLGYAVLGGSANAPGTITDSYAQADVVIDAGVTRTANGGVLGTAINTSLTNVYSTGRVSGADNVGGVVGYGMGVASHYAFANGSVTGTDASVGGLIGSLSQGNIWYSRASGAVTGTSQVGGLIGNMDSAWGPNYVSLLVSPVATGNVTGTGNDLGGLVGHAGGYPGGGYASPAYQHINAAQAFGNVTGSTSASDHVGGLVGYGKYASIAGDINKTSVRGITVTGHNQVGGLIGKNFEGDISYSNVLNVAISGTDEVGGLVGYNTNRDASGTHGSITSSKVTGTYPLSPGFVSTVTGQDYVGGLVGRDDYGSLNSDTVGTIDGSNAVPNVLVSGVNYVGGIAGSTNASDVGSVQLVQAQAEVHGANYTGGAIGIDTGSTLVGTTLTNAKVITVADATSHAVYAVGGLIGKATNTTIKGAILSAGTLNAQDAATTAVRAVGGMVGEATGVTITNNGANGSSVSMNLQMGASSSWTGVADGLGGVVGTMTGGAISQTYSGGSIVLQGTGIKTNIGGVAGLADGVALSEVSSDRAITAAGGSNVGGLVGKLTNGATIIDAFSKGSINPGNSGATNVGGLVGLMDSTGVAVTVDNAYSTTTIASASASTMGALVGGLAGGATAAQITDSFYDNSLNAGLTGLGGSVADSATHVVGKTTVELQNINTFLAAGWDVGAVGSSTNYPLLGYTSQDTHKWTMAGPQTISIYLRLLCGGSVICSSIYGDAPTLTYKLYTAASGGTEITDASETGSVVWSTPLTATSNANTYAETYTSGITLGNSAYSLSVGSAVNWVINPRALNVSVSKIYDGNTNFSYNAAYVFSGMVNSNATPTASGGTVTVSGKNVGNYTAFGSNTLTLSDTNYTLVGGTVSADITAKPLTVTASSVTKTYDGSTSATGSSTVGALASGDSVNAAATLAFTDKNYGVGNKTVLVYGVTIKDGSNADMTGNYDITYVSDTASTINKANLTVNGTTAASKTYDGTTTAALSGGSLQGVIGSESVTLAQAGAFADKNVGTSKTVTAADTLGGIDAGNYSLTQPAGLSAAITAKPIQIAGLMAQDKVFDGTVSVTVTDWGAPAGLVGNETLLLSHGTASFDDASVGRDKTVLATGYSVADGNGGLAANYVLRSSTATTRASIKAVPVVPTIAPPVAPPAPAPVLPAQGQNLQLATGPALTLGAPVSAGGGSASASGITAPAVVSAPQSSAAPNTERFSAISVSMQPSTNVQQAPVVTVAVPKELATSGAGFSFPLPEQVANPTGADFLIAELPNGSPLPAWLKFNPESKVFTGSAVPDGAFPLQLVVVNGTERIIVVISEKAQ